MRLEIFICFNLYNYEVNILIFPEAISPRSSCL